MFNSSILDVVIGLVFCFASVALFVSAVNEAIASALKLRHKTLFSGVKQILNDPQGAGLAAKLYNHALISPLAAGEPGSPRAPEVLPAYIPSQAFARALIDVIQKAPGDMASVAAAVQEVSDPQLQQLLRGFLVRANGSLEVLENQIADWFDNAMNRLSGRYKRRAQAITFALGFVVAAGFNIDSFYVLSELWARPSIAAAISNPGMAANVSLAAGMAAAGTASAPANGGAAAKGFPVEDWMATLRTLPVGWNNGRSMPDVWASPGFYVFFLFGLLVTASSAVFGAPFWFDLLQRLIQVRGTGVKPPADQDKGKPTVLSAATR